jgi:hypothetical protein
MAAALGWITKEADGSTILSAAYAEPLSCETVMFSEAPL